MKTVPSHPRSSLIVFGILGFGALVACADPGEKLGAGVDGEVEGSFTKDDSSDRGHEERKTGNGATEAGDVASGAAMTDGDEPGEEDFVYKGLGGAGGSDGSDGGIVTGTYTDPRDGQEYGWVQHGELQWMTRNLTYLGDSGEEHVDVYKDDSLVWVAAEPDGVNPVEAYRADYYDLEFVDDDIFYTPPGGSRTAVQIIEYTAYRVVAGYDGSDVEEARASAKYLSNGVYYSYFDALGVCPSEGGWRLPSVSFSKNVYYELDCLAKDSDIERSVCYYGWKGTCDDPQFSSATECQTRAAFERNCEQKNGVRKAACFDGIESACADSQYADSTECSGSPTALEGECDGLSGVDLSACMDGWVATCADPTYASDVSCVIEPDYEDMCSAYPFQAMDQGCREGWIATCDAGASSSYCKQTPDTYWGDWVDLAHTLSSREDLESNKPNRPYLFKGVGSRLRSESWENGTNTSLLNMTPTGFYSWGGITSEEVAEYHGKTSTREEIVASYWDPSTDIAQLSYIQITPRDSVDSLHLNAMDYDIWTASSLNPVRCVRDAQ